MRKILGSGETCIQKTMGTGECDVTAAASAKQGNNREYQVREFVQMSNAADCLNNRRFGTECYIKYGNNHDAS